MWKPTRIGPFAPVYLNGGLNLDFIETDDDSPVEHFCFRVGDAEFDAILARMRDAFYVDTPAWKAMVYGQARTAVMQALVALTEA